MAEERYVFGRGTSSTTPAWKKMKGLVARWNERYEAANSKERSRIVDEEIIQVVGEDNFFRMRSNGTSTKASRREIRSHLQTKFCHCKTSGTGSKAAYAAYSKGLPAPAPAPPTSLLDFLPPLSLRGCHVESAIMQQSCNDSDPNLPNSISTILTLKCDHCTETFSVCRYNSFISCPRCTTLAQELKNDVSKNISRSNEIQGNPSASQKQGDNEPAHCDHAGRARFSGIGNSDLRVSPRTEYATVEGGGTEENLSNKQAPRAQADNRNKLEDNATTEQHSIAFNQEVQQGDKVVHHELVQASIHGKDFASIDSSADIAMLSFGSSLLRDEFVVHVRQPQGEAELMQKVEMEGMTWHEHNSIISEMSWEGEMFVSEPSAMPTRFSAENVEVFLSHTTASSNYDTATFVSWTGQTLSERHSINAFLDATHLENGSEWRDEIERAVKSCRVFVAVLTPAYFLRYWCMKELHLAVQQKKQLLSVHLGCDPPVHGNVPLLLDPRFREEFLAFHRNKGINERTLQEWCQCIVRLESVQELGPTRMGKLQQEDLKENVVESVKKLLDNRNRLATDHQNWTLVRTGYFA